MPCQTLSWRDDGLRTINKITDNHIHSNIKNHTFIIFLFMNIVIIVIVSVINILLEILFP